jgi:hypothetical protein
MEADMRSLYYYSAYITAKNINPYPANVENMVSS